MESCHVSVDHYQAAISLAAPPAGMVQCCPRPGGTKGLTFALSHLKAAPHRASFTLLARCTEPNITGKLLKLKFFDAFMRPVMSYSCKFWAPSASNAALLYLERVHVGFPRRLLGAPQLPSPDAEMGRQPCTTSWSKQVLLDMSYVHLHTAVKVDWSEETLLLTVCRRWAGQHACCTIKPRRLGVESCHVSVDHYQAAISLAAPPAGMVQCCPRPGGTKGLTFALSHLKAAPHRASFTLLARCTEPNITGKLLKLKFFDAFMRPVMSYSCKFWAPSASNAALLYLERVHVGFPRRLLGAPQLPSPDAEMGRQPCTTSWSKQVLLDMSYVHLHTAVKVDWSEETLLLTVCRRWAGMLHHKAPKAGSGILSCQC